VACCRQNMKESTGHPWFMMACQNAAQAGSVDGIQFYGRTYRETGIPEGMLADHLAGEYAGESSVFALQEKTIWPGGRRGSSQRFCWYLSTRSSPGHIRRGSEPPVRPHARI